MPYSNYFADSYTKVRHNFMLGCQDQAILLESWQHPLRGISGEKLYLDLAWFGDLAAKKVLVLISGTHGIEGFCGSGIQVGSIKTGWHHQGDRDVAIMMIHGLNPWGMSHLRRVNEDGVDLNRNFLDFQQPLPKNVLYGDLVDIIIPEQWTEETQEKTLTQIVEYLANSQYQIDDLAKGQYQYWYAPFYGGEVPTWSNRVFGKLVAKYLQDRQAVGVIDYHTGLGEYATGQLIGLPHNTISPNNLAAEIWGDKIAIAGAENSVAAYHPQGTLIETIQRKLENSTCIAAAYEFGTIPQTEVFHALRADHWLHIYGETNSKLASEIKQDMLQAFYSDRQDWQESICNLAFIAQEELYIALKSL